MRLWPGSKRKRTPLPGGPPITNFSSGLSTSRKKKANTFCHRGHREHRVWVKRIFRKQEEPKADPFIIYSTFLTSVISVSSVAYNFFMNSSLRHSWKVTPKEAIRIQEGLRKKLQLGPPPAPFKTVAAADVSYSRTDEKLFAAFLVFSYPDLTLLETAAARGRSSFPYIPGLLSF